MKSQQNEIKIKQVEDKQPNQKTYLVSVDDIEQNAEKG